MDEIFDAPFELFREIYDVISKFVGSQENDDIDCEHTECW